MKRKRTRFEDDQKKDINAGNCTNRFIPKYHVDENGMRVVEEYECEFKCFAKKRWLDRRIIDVFSAEFCYRTLEYYTEAIETGKITVNGEKVSIDYLVKDSDCIVHKMLHREPPVSSTPIGIIFEDDELLVVDKPADLPVHPTGRYRHNTLVNILCDTHGYDKLFPIHRLDRLTSGVLLLAKSSKTCQKYSLLFQLHNQNNGKNSRIGVEKEYIARVKGSPHESNFTVNAPLSTICPVYTLNGVDFEHGKEAETRFVRHETVPSLIKCYPVTGRTHQIRVHLRYLGLPIANDPIYNNDELWSEFEDKLALVDELKQAAGRLVSKRREKVGDDDEKCSVEKEELWLHACKIRIQHSEKEDDFQEFSSISKPEWMIMDGH